jgi:hypothetical protein
MKIKILPLILFGSVIIILLTVFVGYPISVLNPGFEGPKCYFYGTNLLLPQDWDGANVLHRYQDAEPYLAYHEYYGAWDKISWGTVATPNDAVLNWQYHPTSGLGGTIAKPELGIHVESNIQLQDINRQGDPLGWNTTDPMNAEYIEYWTKTAIKTETADKIQYHYEVNKESFLLVPVEFWVGFYLVPSQSNAGTFSGWREGEWQNILVWFRLDFNIWDNAYYDPWLDDPQINVFDSLYGGQILNQNKTADYRGGFPIAGWIQGWEKAGFTSDTSAGEQESSLWYNVKGGNVNQQYTVDQLASLKDSLMAKCEFAPGMVGQFITLYDSPDAAFTYELSEQDFSESVTQDVKSPDSSMKKVMYFPINIANFGTFADGNVWNGFKIYYPSAYFRVRMIYGVYGNFTYLWTEEVTKPTDQGGLDYPATIETHGTTIISTPGIWTQMGSLLWIIIAIVIIIIVIFGLSIFMSGAGMSILLFSGGRG